MKICIIGTGYVGLVAGACLADMGHEVICVDNNPEKVSSLKKGIIPIYEPGLEELIKNNVEDNRLFFTDDIKLAVQSSKVCFIAVGTPQGEDGSCDLKYVLEVAKSIGENINDYKVIVDKSTVPVGTAEKVKDVIKSQTNIEFDVVSNPEFLKQGAAVEDFMKPDRIIIGADSQKAIKIMQEVYESFLRTSNRIIIMDVKSAEMTKYAANSFLATKISFMNEIANLCEKTGANAHNVRLGISTDTRIGNKFLFPGIGYGGSCFPKDVKALINTGKEYGYDMKIISSVEEINRKQRVLFVEKILKKFENNVKNKTFALWGLAFKPKTNDMREAPSIDVINALLKRGASIKAFDPKAMDSAKLIFNDKITYCKDAYEALENSDALILLTEWNEFRNPDFSRLKCLLNNPIIIDARNQYNKKELIEQGIDYTGIGI